MSLTLGSVLHHCHHCVLYSHVLGTFFKSTAEGGRTGNKPHGIFEMRFVEENSEIRTFYLCCYSNMLPSVQIH